MFFLVALTIWTAMNVYVLWRVHGVPWVAAHVPTWVLVVAGVFLALSYLLARVLEALKQPTIGVALEWIGAIWMGVLVVSLGCFFLADVVTAFGLVVRQHVPAIRTVALIASVVLSLAAVLNAMRTPVVREHEVRMPNLPAAADGTVVVAISDLHLGTMTTRGWMSRVVEQIDEAKPDLVLIAGDLVEGDLSADREIPQSLGEIRASRGVWMVPGNHEQHQQSIDGILERSGIHVLRDTSAEITPGLFVAGVDTAGHERVAGRGLVERAMARVPRDAAAIVLSHYPEQMEKAAARGAGLMIAGHTHAGQIWPFNYFVRMQYRHLGGRYEIGGMPLIVCRGTGTWGPPMRLFRPNEILRIVLRRP